MHFYSTKRKILEHIATMTLRYSENNWKDYRTVKAVHDRVHQQPRWMGFAEGVSKSSTTAASFVVGQVLQIEAGAIIALEAVARLPAANLPALALATKLNRDCCTFGRASRTARSHSPPCSTEWHRRSRRSAPCRDCLCRRRRVRTDHRRQRPPLAAQEGAECGSCLSLR